MGAEGLKVRGGGDLVVNKVGPKLRYWVQLLLPPNFFQDYLGNILTKTSTVAVGSEKEWRI